MRERADRSRSPSPSRNAGIRDLVSYGLIVGAVVLGWQIALQPLMLRAPVETAIRLAPGSPLVLRRAAESELAAGRIGNAAALSREALVRSPFDVQALRVLGLTEARAGREDSADEILTLAGNWSLRDGPAHAWLVERRLRQGDYASAFAHADTLARRRSAMGPQVFRLFTVAGIEDPQRSLPVFVSLLATRPPWREGYLNSLNQTPQELQLAASLAVLLEASRAPLTSDELQRLYRALLERSQLQALSTVRGRIGRPPPSDAVTNGGFSEPGAPVPFQWSLFQENVGIGVDIVADDLRPSNPALRVEYDGYAIGTVARQLTFLPPGAHRFTAEIRTETGNPGDRLVWTLTCTSRDAAIAFAPAEIRNADPNAWTTLSSRFEVPSTCPAQWLSLETRADNRRSPTVVWFDRLSISPVD